MPRLARVVATGHPHHVIQRGNRRQKVFFGDKDKEEYLKILDLNARLFQVKVWAYCLMDNHVHLIVVPQNEKSLTKTIGLTHQLYTRLINFRQGWNGYLWQGRFKSVVLDEKYLYSAVRYVENNPVRAGIVSRAEDYLWSSAKAHVNKENEGLLSWFYLLDEIRNWRNYLSEEDTKHMIEIIREHTGNGRPLGEVRGLLQ